MPLTASSRLLHPAPVDPPPAHPRAPLYPPTHLFPRRHRSRTVLLGLWPYYQRGSRWFATGSWWRGQTRGTGHHEATGCRLWWGAAALYAGPVQEEQHRPRRPAEGSQVCELLVKKSRVLWVGLRDDWLVDAVYFISYACLVGWLLCHFRGKHSSVLVCAKNGEMLCVIAVISFYCFLLINITVEHFLCYLSWFMALYTNFFYLI